MAIPCVPANPLGQEAARRIRKTTTTTVTGSPTMKPQFMSKIQGEINVRFVAIPAIASSAKKGTTKFDAVFESLLDFKEAIQIPEDDFHSLRKAASRFLDNRNMTDKVSIRQKKDHRTKTYLMWFLNEPPASRRKK